MDVFGKYTEVLIRWLDCLDRGERPKIFGDGRQTMDFVHVEDVARANVLAMESDVSDQVFNVASGEETSLLGLLEALLRAVGMEHVAPEFLPERAVNPVPRRLADTSKAEKLLGFRAKSVARGRFAAVGRLAEGSHRPRSAGRLRRRKFADGNNEVKP